MAKWLGLLGAGVVLAAGAASAIGCSSSETDKYPSVDSFCAARAQEECKAADECGTQVAVCLSQRKASCTSSPAATSRPYHSGNAQGCIDKTHDTYAKDTITPDDLAALQTECDKVFQGSATSLGRCDTTQDCSGDLVCDKSVCAKRVEKNPGDFCGNPGEVCGGESYCATTAGALQCVPRKALNEVCDAKIAPCQTTLRCNGSCQARAESGQACATDDDCAADAPYCDPANGNKCDKGLRFGPGLTACKDYGGP